MEDMVQFKTEFTLCSRFLGESGSFRLNKYAFKRIEKMLNKRFKWNIENLPFVVSKMQADDKQTECCICYSHFKKNRDTKMKGKFKVQFYINIVSSITYITKSKITKEPLIMKTMISSLSALSVTPSISLSAQGQLPIKLIQ
jgi:hypothetical protein